MGHPIAFGLSFPMSVQSVKIRNVRLLVERACHHELTLVKLEKCVAPFADLEMPNRNFTEFPHYSSVKGTVFYAFEALRERPLANYYGLNAIRRAQ
ncbi:hypothetical protein ElyMa_001855700 [Elysia marginata]|uniref:Uncharacterized protein n=1 Tax=Elysia marginata TaxID=1093978 RepID=A0AAV4ELC8_9GAST|nr:hypothetical protein ElyMa_001855700 [Elysia marginata]